MAGLKPNDFHWIIEGKLAVSECIGGGGLTPRKIRREEEIQWLKGQGINAIFSLLDSDFNLKNNPFEPGSPAHTQWMSKNPDTPSEGIKSALSAYCDFEASLDPRVAKRAKRRGLLNEVKYHRAYQTSLKNMSPGIGQKILTLFSTARVDDDGNIVKDGTGRLMSDADKR